MIRVAFGDLAGCWVDRHVSEVVARDIINYLTRQLARTEVARGEVSAVGIGRERSHVYLVGSDEAHAVTRAAALLAAAEDAGAIAVYSDGTIERVTE